MSDSVRPQRRQPTRIPCPWDSPGKNTGVDCHFLLQFCCYSDKNNLVSLETFFGATVMQSVWFKTFWQFVAREYTLQYFQFWNSLSYSMVQDIMHLCKYSAAAAAKSLQSCLTLCDPIHGSPPGCPIPGILQARTLEWVAISFSRYDQICQIWSIINVFPQWK